MLDCIGSDSTDPGVAYMLSSRIVVMTCDHRYAPPGVMRSSVLSVCGLTHIFTDLWTYMLPQIIFAVLIETFLIKIE